MNDNGPVNKLMIEPEYEAVYNNWKANPTPQTRAALSAAVLPLIKQTLSASGADTENPVLLAKGRMMAVQSLKRYDPSKAKLGNFLYSQLLGLNRVLGKTNNIIQIPEAIVLDKKNLERAEKDLEDSLGRMPSTTELSDYTGLSEKRIAKLRQAALPMAMSQLKTDEGAPMSPSTHILGDTSKQNAWQEYVYDSLDDRKRAIMERLYGMHGFKQKSPAQIAKELKISTAAISQQRKKIDEALNSELQFNLFGND